jgi:fibronectin-binding autotransporter adhesin
MKRRSRFCELLCVISLAAIVAPGWAGTAQAASGTWKADVAGNWSATGSWTGGNIPGSTTVLNSADVATFGFALATNDRIVTVDTSRNIGTITFSHTSGKKYTLSSGSLLLSSGGVIHETSAASGTHTDNISSAIAIQGDGGTATFTVSGGTATTLLSIGAVTGVSAGANITTLTLNGTNSGANAITGIIGNGSAGGKLAIIKNGAGSWTLSGTNTFTGGVTLSAGTLKVGSAKALGAAAGKLTIAGGTLDSDGKTISNNNSQDWNGDFTYSGASGNLNLGDGAVTMNASRKVTVGASGSILTVGGVISGGGYGLTKLGAGTLTLDGSAVNTFRGGLSIYAGTLELDFANLGTPTNLINSGNTLTLGSGTLSIIGKTGAFSTSQTFSSLTVNGGGAILLNPKGGTGTTIPLGSIATVNAVGRSLRVGTGAGAGGGNAIITTTDNKDSRGIYGGRIVYMLDGGTSVDWATTASVSSPYTFGAYGAYTTMVAGATSDALNDITTGSLTLTGAHTHNTLKLTNGATLALGANTLTLTSGGLLSTGAVTSTISGDAGATGLMGGNNGSGSYDLVVHQYNTGTGGLTISAVIGDNGAHPTALTKSGAGTCELILSGLNTYTGDTIVNKGTLSISHAYLNDAAAVKIDLDARMNLNFGGEDQIAELWLGGAQMAPGTYNSGTPTYGSYFTGAGSLHVVLVRLPGDTNLDGVVDAADYITVKQNFGRTGADWSQGNFTVGDSNVDWADLQILMANFGTRGAGGAPAAPEPGSVMLLMFGAVAVLRRRRRVARSGFKPQTKRILPQRRRDSEEKR